MSNLNDLIDKTHFDYEENEAIEELKSTMNSLESKLNN